MGSIAELKRLALDSRPLPQELGEAEHGHERTEGQNDSATGNKGLRHARYFLTGEGTTE